MSDSPERTLAVSPYLHLIERNGWYFARRPGQIGSVMLVALTDDNELLFVQQHRAPLGVACIELPAGLAGDEARYLGEPLTEAAQRRRRRWRRHHAVRGPAAHRGRLAAGAAGPGTRRSRQGVRRRAVRDAGDCQRLTALYMIARCPTVSLFDRWIVTGSSSDSKPS